MPAMHEGEVEAKKRGEERRREEKRERVKGGLLISDTC
jgi:hypothetical protein